MEISSVLSCHHPLYCFRSQKITLISTYAGFNFVSKSVKTAKSQKCGFRAFDEVSWKVAKRDVPHAVGSWRQLLPAVFVCFFVGQWAGCGQQGSFLPILQAKLKAYINSRSTHEVVGREFYGPCVLSDSGGAAPSAAPPSLSLHLPTDSLIYMFIIFFCQVLKCFFFFQNGSHFPSYKNTLTYSYQ